MYIDTSALAKLYLKEPDSEPCRRAADGHGLFTSSLALAEFQSTLLRHEREDRLTASEGGLVWKVFRQDIEDGRIYLSPMNDLIVHQASDIMWQLHPEIPIRTLDAIHLATCWNNLSIDSGGVLTTDKRFASAAQKMGIPVVALT